MAKRTRLRAVVMAPRRAIAALRVETRLGAARLAYLDATNELLELRCAWTAWELWLTGDDESRCRLAAMGYDDPSMPDLLPVQLLERLDGALADWQHAHTDAGEIVAQRYGGAVQIDRHHAELRAAIGVTSP